MWKIKTVSYSFPSSHGNRSLAMLNASANIHCGHDGHSLSRSPVAPFLYSQVQRYSYLMSSPNPFSPIAPSLSKHQLSSYPPAMKHVPSPYPLPICSPFSLYS